jgi:hypothetical protein
MTGRRNGGVFDQERDPLLPGPAPEALKDHVFKALPTDEKLDVLIALYSGLASKVESTRRDFANREADIHSKVDELSSKVDRVLSLEQALLQHFGIRVPTEPPPPPPRRRRTDG